MESAPNPSNSKAGKIAVVDLGTNTFHLLIANHIGDDWSQELRLRKYVQLGEEGIATIGAAALTRAFDALVAFKEILSEEAITRYQVNGTAALRTASNGPDFLQKVQRELGIEINIIDGNREAKLIYLGVRQAMPLTMSPQLIMDIGGGSVEFIIANKKELLWAQSFPIGVAVLFKKFQTNDPITQGEIEHIAAFLEKTFAPIRAKLLEHPCDRLIGASGTFDVLEKLLEAKVITPHASSIETSDFFPLYQEFISSDLALRLEWPGLPQQRAQLIIVALILIHEALKLQAFKQVIVSKYAMKEGMIAQLLSKS